MSYDTRDLSREVAPTSALRPNATQPKQQDREPRLVKHPQSKLRRDRMRELRICINSSFVMPLPPLKDGAPQRPHHAPTITHRPIVQHGPVVRSGKCQRCLDVHAGREPSPVTEPHVYPLELPRAYVFVRMPRAGIMRRRVVEMLLDGKTPRDIAAIENKPLMNIHSAVRHARKVGELA